MGQSGVLKAFQKLHYVLSYFCILTTDLFSKTDGQRSLSQAFRCRRMAVMRIRVNTKAD